MTLFVVIADQISKLCVKGFSIPLLNIKHKGMSLGQSVDVIGSFFRITFVENPGMAFGVDLDTGMKLMVSLFSLAAAIGIVFYLYKVKDKSFTLRLSLALILAGAVGNLIDRFFYGVFYSYAPVFYGRVVDFLDFDFWHFSLFGRSFERWPVFNIADMAVSIGVFILLIFYKKHNSETSPATAPITEELIEADSKTDIDTDASASDNPSSSVIPPVAEKREDDKVL